MKTEIELHVHPFLGRNDLKDVIQAMNNQNLDIIAMESLDFSLFPYIIEETKKFYPESLIQDEGIKLPDGKYLLNAREYNTQEKIHILTVGYSLDEANPNTEIRKIIDKGLENDALILLDHPFVDNGRTKTAGHISKGLAKKVEDICKEYSGNITLEWNGYCIPWIREALMHGLNLTGFDIKYFDVNKKAEKLSDSLKKQGFNIPLLADTDLHARTKRHLNYMGTSRIITNLEAETPKETLQTLKKNVFKGNYDNIKKYVSTSHLLESFCIPVILPKYFEKPRA